MLVRTRVARSRRHPDKWEWWLWSEIYDDHCFGFDTEDEARADLAKAVEHCRDGIARDEDVRQFWKVAFG